MPDVPREPEAQGPAPDRPRESELLVSSFRFSWEQPLASWYRGEVPPEAAQAFRYREARRAQGDAPPAGIYVATSRDGGKTYEGKRIYSEPAPANRRSPGRSAVRYERRGVRVGVPDARPRGACPRRAHRRGRACSRAVRHARDGRSRR